MAAVLTSASLRCRSLSRFQQTGSALSSGNTSESASGNGSIMRLAPVPIRYQHLFPCDIESLARFAEESSLTTHASEQCLSASRYMALVLTGLIHGQDRGEVLSPSWEPLTRLKAVKPLNLLVEKVADGSFRSKQPPDIRGSGWVIQSLEAALWAFHDATSFEEAVLRAVNLGEDADTTGAVCGQFAGAYWGESGIAESLRAGLARQDMIEKALEEIVV
jgi:ADP-ribosyl-[dinitrogen reductase] hydrolase